MKGRAPSLREQLAWWLASYGERRLQFCRVCHVRRKPDDLICSNCDARVADDATSPD